MRVTEYSPPARAVAFVLSLAVLNLVQPANALAQINVSSSSFAGGTVTSPILFPDGTDDVPSWGWASDADGTGTGMFRNAANNITATLNGVPKVRMSSTGAIGLAIASDLCLTWGSTADVTSGSNDLLACREAAATLQLGVDVNGAAITQTVKAADGITGTDIAGSPFIGAGGRGTGAGQPGDYTLQTATQLATGTTAQTLVTRYHAEGGTRTLTDASATTVFTVTTGNDLSCGGQMFFAVEAADASNQQMTTGSVNFAAVDNAAGAGGEVCASAVTGTNTTAVNSGTLTVTSDATTGTDLCNIRLTATGSLTETVGPRVRYSVVFNPTSSTCAITPQ